MNAIRFYQKTVLVLICVIFLCFGFTILISSTNIFNFSTPSEKAVEKIAGFLEKTLFVPVRFVAGNLRISENGKPPPIEKGSFSASLDPLNEKKIIVGYARSVNFGYLAVMVMVDSKDQGKKQEKTPCLENCLVHNYILLISPKLTPDINDPTIGKIIVVLAKSTFIFQEKFETGTEWQYFLSEKIVEKLNFRRQAAATSAVAAGAVLLVFASWVFVATLVKIKKIARPRKARINNFAALQIFLAGNTDAKLKSVVKKFRQKAKKSEKRNPCEQREDFPPLLAVKTSETRGPKFLREEKNPAKEDAPGNFELSEISINRHLPVTIPETKMKRIGNETKNGPKKKDIQNTNKKTERNLYDNLHIPPCPKGPVNIPTMKVIIMVLAANKAFGKRYLNAEKARQYVRTKAIRLNLTVENETYRVSVKWMLEKGILIEHAKRNPTLSLNLDESGDPDIGQETIKEVKRWYFSIKDKD